MIYESKKEAERAIPDFIDEKEKEGFTVRCILFPDDMFCVYYFKKTDVYASVEMFRFKKEE